MLDRGDMFFRRHVSASKAAGRKGRLVDAPERSRDAILVCDVGTLQQGCSPGPCTGTHSQEVSISTKSKPSMGGAFRRGCDTVHYSAEHFA